MSVNDPSRPLRYEQLEKRSLLAAGIFDFAMDDAGDGPQRDRAQRDRAHEFDRGHAALAREYSRGTAEIQLGKDGHLGRPDASTNQPSLRTSIHPKDADHRGKSHRHKGSAPLDAPPVNPPAQSESLNLQPQPTLGVNAAALNHDFLVPGTAPAPTTNTFSPPQDTLPPQPTGTFPDIVPLRPLPVDQVVGDRIVGGQVGGVEPNAQISGVSSARNSSDAVNQANQLAETDTSQTLTSVTTDNSNGTIENSVAAADALASEDGSQRSSDPPQLSGQTTSADSIETMDSPFSSRILGHAPLSQQYVNGGLIDFEAFGLARADLDRSAHGSKSKEGSSWALAAETLPDLRSVIERTIIDRVIVEQAVEELTEAIHDFSLTWRDGSGGMVALDQVLLPDSFVSVQHERIEVQLESTVMLHRSFAMIAGGGIETLSDSALDAIMTSLGAATEETAQPVYENGTTRLATLTYPAVALLTGASMAAIKKRNEKSRRLQTKPTNGTDSQSL